MISVPNGNRPRRATSGFTLIELMIVVAIIAILLSLALPVYTNYTTRTKVGEALSIGAGAKTAVASTCIEDPTIDPLDNARAGYDFGNSKYVESIVASGPCLTPVVTITTQNIGVTPDIVLTLTGDLEVEGGRVTWVCASNTDNNNVPHVCRI